MDILKNIERVKTSATLDINEKSKNIKKGFIGSLLNLDID